MKTTQQKLFRLPKKRKPVKKNQVSQPACAQKNTYIRKYYLHRRIKADGFELQLEKCHKTIWVTSGNIEKANDNKYISELQHQYNYGVQILNPMTDDRESI